MAIGRSNGMENHQQEEQEEQEMMMMMMVVMMTMHLPLTLIVSAVIPLP